MPDVDSTIGEILHLAHHAAGNPNLWDEVLARLRAHLNAPLIAFIDHNFITHQGEISHAAGVDERFRVLYRARFSGKNVWLNVERRFMSGETFTGAELVPNWELVRTEFYRDWLRPLHAFHCLIGIIFGCAEEVRGLVALRPLDEPGFNAQDKHELTSLLKRIQCACELGAEFAATRRKIDILSDVLQTLSEAILIVDRECHPVFLNRAAERLLTGDDHLKLVHGMLTAASSHETSQLRRLVDEAAGCNCGGIVRSNGELAITCPSGGRPLVLQIKPIPHSVIDRSGKHKHVAAVFVGTTEMTEAARQLYEFYHLTPAEARLAALIVSGYSLHEAASKLHISNNTASTHMKRIYDKTEVHRQVDLVRLMSNGATPPH
jgi:DNA-binding CsgD family transcriptional regulator/PAS domain-containing protein